MGLTGTTPIALPPHIQMVELEVAAATMMPQTMMMDDPQGVEGLWGVDLEVAASEMMVTMAGHHHLREDPLPNILGGGETQYHHHHHLWLQWHLKFNSSYRDHPQAQEEVRGHLEPLYLNKHNSNLFRQCRPHKMFLPHRNPRNLQGLQ